MRVIAGRFGRRKLVAPEGNTTRPTPDRLRESLFSILTPILEGETFHDLYCGSGAVGIEALSRGARQCTFIESDRAALAALQSNLQSLGITREALVIPKRVKAVLKDYPASGIVFVDPPYNLKDEYDSALNSLADSAATLILVQHDRRLALPPEFGRFRHQRLLKQGDNCISFYAPA